MRIGVDVDGVLADFNKTYIDRVIQVTGRDLFPARPFVIPCWDYPQHYGYTGAELSAVWSLIRKDTTFWRWLSVCDQTVPDAVRLLNFQTRAGDDAYFITSRPGLLAKRQTEQWLYDLGMDNPTVLICDQKGVAANALNLDCYIDDRPENCCATDPYCRTYIQTRSWNLGYDLPQLVRRVDHISEMLELESVNQLD